MLDDALEPPLPLLDPALVDPPLVDPPLVDPPLVDPPLVDPPLVALPDVPVLPPLVDPPEPLMLSDVVPVISTRCPTCFFRSASLPSSM